MSVEAGECQPIVLHLVSVRRTAAAGGGVGVGRCLVGANH